jgi:hypothetical protein
MEPRFIACDKSAAGMSLRANGEELMGLQREDKVCFGENPSVQSDTTTLSSFLESQSDARYLCFGNAVCR